MSTPPPLPPPPAPLDPALTELLDAERARSEPAADTRHEVFAALQVTIGGAAPRATPLRSPLTTARTTIAAVAALAFSGGVAVGAWAHARFAPSTAALAPPSAESRATLPPTAPTPPSAPPAVAAPVHDPVFTVPPKAAQPAPPSADPDLAAEQVLVETGRSALARGDAAGALTALERHAREFPSGRLAEERDVLRIQALAAQGRRDDARARAIAFRARYPKSVFLPILDEVLSPSQ